MADDDSFTFRLLPMVLAELDELKNAHRNPDFREKVSKVTRRIKGWRNQDTLRIGVIVDGTITVRAVAVEADMQHKLTWLDKGNRDNRIIASWAHDFSSGVSKLLLPIASGSGGSAYRPELPSAEPSHISNTVLSIVKIGPPEEARNLRDSQYWFAGCMRDLSPLKGYSPGNRRTTGMKTRRTPPHP